jgi:hypothetical protein
MKKLLNSLVIIIIPVLLIGQKAKEVDLTRLFKSKQLEIVNRQAKLMSQGDEEYLEVSESGEEGLIWLPEKSFKNGSLEIEMRGKDLFQKSFVGIAFHGSNDSTYEAVYCRPFNFFAKDSIRRIHAIQYISHPVYTWKKLRDERNGVFEKEIISPPDLNGWFIMRLEINGKVVKAYINNAQTPSLVVERIGNIDSGKIGLFTGDGAGGDFKKLKIKYKK